MPPESVRMGEQILRQRSSFRGFQLLRLCIVRRRQGGVEMRIIRKGLRLLIRVSFNNVRGIAGSLNRQFWQALTAPVEVSHGIQ